MDIGTWAPYGYSKSPEDPHRLIINHETAPVVRQIFAWRLEGISFVQIARRLNSAGVLSPSAYLYETGQVKTEKYHGVLWHNQVLRNILTHPVYLGHMVQGRKRQSFSEGQKQVFMPESEWAVVKNTHEAIIDQQTFDAVQELMRRSNEVYHSRLGKFDDLGGSENIFRGLVCCEDCKRPLVRYKNVSHQKKLWYTFICPSHADNPEACPKKNIREDTLTEIVLSAIQKQTALAADMDNVIRTINASPTFCRQIAASKKRLTAAKVALTRCRSLYDSLYQNYVEKLMTEEEYIALKTRYRQQAEEAQRVISALELEEQNGRQFTPENLFLQAFLRFQFSEALTRDMLTALIERIEVDEHGGVAIQFRYKDEFQALAAFIEGRDEK